MPDAKDYPVEFTLRRFGEDNRIQTHTGEYYSLMTLIADKMAIAGFGLCSGMGSCGTCLVQVDNRNVMACATSINDDLANVVVVIPDKMY